MAPITSDISYPSGWGGSSISAARVPGVPAFAGNAYVDPNYLISFTFDDMGNGSNVQYCFYVEENGSNKGFVTPSTGIIRAETDPTADITADWATASTWTAVITMTGLTASTTYRVKGKARNEDATETAYSSWSGIWMSYIALATSPISSAYTEEITTGNTKLSSLSITGTSNVITFGYTLTNKLASASAVKFELSLDNGGTYPTDITSQVTGATTGLTAAATGSAHTNTWASCTYLGNSYSGTIYIRATPIDDSAREGASSNTSAAIDNRPLSTTISEIHAYLWDADTTPSFVAEMQSIVCGSTLYFVITATPTTGTKVIKSSAEELSGWMYEQDHTNNPGENDTDVNWTQCPATGVPAAYITGGNRVRYTFQSALTAGMTYNFTIVQAEVVNVLV